MGFGLTIGYQWLMQSGLGLDAYLGPMFRGITKEFTMEGRSPSEAEASSASAPNNGTGWGGAGALQQQYGALVHWRPAHQHGVLGLENPQCLFSVLAVVEAMLLVGGHPHGNQAVHHGKQGVTQAKRPHRHRHKGGDVLAKRLELP